MGTINHLHLSGIVPLNSIYFKVGDGSSIRFWKDTWLGNDPLYIRYNRLFHLENNKDCFISQCILNGSWEWDWCSPITMGRSKIEFDNLIIDISNMEIDDLVESDTCVWSLFNDDSFLMNSVRKRIDEHSLPSLFSCTWWYKMIPKKSIILRGLTAKGIASIAIPSSSGMIFTNCFSSAAFCLHPPSASLIFLVQGHLLLSLNCFLVPSLLLLSLNSPPPAQF
nr:RNA-directed DNA polymerase, eukaryota, reverse transcriptase zinc-binding domain protein [Tanacetum cinerariifolium]